MVPVFIGYDSRETVAWHVLAHSLIRHSTIPLAISPIGNEVLPKCYWWRKRGPHDSTEFSNARFAVPTLMDFRGWAVFMDCDMICEADLTHLWAQRNDDYAVMVVKHDHRPVEERKFLGAEQSKYRLKNWSSLMLFNCGHPACFNLTPERINSMNGLDLHQFRWVEDRYIGAIRGLWNVLSLGDRGYFHPEPVEPGEIKLLHYTLGGPWHGYEPVGQELWDKGFHEMTVQGNPCADMVSHAGGEGTLRFSGRFRRLDP